jgi:hypothetical protein
MAVLVRMASKQPCGVQRRTSSMIFPGSWLVGWVTISVDLILPLWAMM